MSILFETFHTPQLVVPPAGAGCVSLNPSFILLNRRRIHVLWKIVRCLAKSCSTELSICKVYLTSESFSRLGREKGTYFKIRYYIFSFLLLNTLFSTWSTLFLSSYCLLHVMVSCIYFHSWPFVKFQLVKLVNNVGLSEFNQSIILCLLIASHKPSNVLFALYLITEKI